MKEAENKHFDVTKILQSFGFCSQTKCLYSKRSARQQKVSLIFIFLPPNWKINATRLSSECAIGPVSCLSKWKVKMKVAFCCSMVTYQTIGIPLRTNKRILKYLLLRQKAHMCSYLHSPTGISENYHKIKISQKLYLLEKRWLQNWNQWPKLTLNQLTKHWNQSGCSPSVINYPTPVIEGINQW